MTATTTTAPLTYRTYMDDTVPMRRIRLEVSIEMYAYVPVDYQPVVEGTELAERIESDLKDAIDYHGGNLGDFESTDALLITDETSVSVNVLEDADPDPDVDTPTLENWVAARHAGA